MENELHGESETSNISGTTPPIIFILSPYVCDNDGLLNTNYYDDLDIIDEGHSKGNISKFCLFLGCPWNDLKKIRSQWWHRGQQQKNVISSDIETVGQVYYLQKLL